MDRNYFILMYQLSECMRLASSISANANYSQAAKCRSDELILDCCKETSALTRTLQEVINEQQRVAAAQHPS